MVQSDTINSQFKEFYIDIDAMQIGHILDREYVGMFSLMIKIRDSCTEASLSSILFALDKLANSRTSERQSIPIFTLDKEDNGIAVRCEGATGVVKLAAIKMINERFPYLCLDYRN